MYAADDRVVKSCIPFWGFNRSRPKLRRWASTGSWTPATFDNEDLSASCDRIDIKCSAVEVACDFAKRKHAVCLNAQSMGAELPLKANNAKSAKEWLNVLQEQSLILPSYNTPSSPSFLFNVSPSFGSKTFHKLGSPRNRSPTGELVKSKTRKSARTSETQQTSPKSRNWKNKMAKQFRRIQPGGGSSMTAPAVVVYPPGATIGVPLEACPSSSFSEFVPLLVEICTEIVEAKGLEIIGIYRVPGNTAAVTWLTEAVNQGLDITILDKDSRWSDVNVISSLLKSFFRKLPDALLTTKLYPHFITADRIADPVLRIATIRKLVHSLPDHNFETLKHLLFHLKKVVDNSCVNKMEARNLAIVFGPTLVRNGDDMVTMVTDMSHQCRVVESLLCYTDWCFSQGNLVELKDNIPEVSSVPKLESTLTNQNLLLENIKKVEVNMQSKVTTNDVVSTIIGAANRKMQKTSKHILVKDRKAHTINLSLPSSNISDDSLNSVQNHQVQSSFLDTKYTKKKETSKSVDNLVISISSNGDIMDSVTDAKETSEDLKNKNQSNVNTGDTWTYSRVSATTQERIRRFEQETKPMLQRELSRPRRMSNYAIHEKRSDELKKKNAEISHVTNEKELPIGGVCGSAAERVEMVLHQHHQPFSDKWRHTVLQEMQVENTRRKPKLFYSNSVKLQRSKSLKEDVGANGRQLRRSNSLNKRESKMSLFEMWMLTKNAEAVKLKYCQTPFGVL